MPCWSNWIHWRRICGLGDGFPSLIYHFLVKGVFVYRVFFLACFGALLTGRALHLGFVV